MLAPWKDFAHWWGWNGSCLSCWSRGGICPDLILCQLFPSGWVSATHWYACKSYKSPCGGTWHHEGGWGSHLLPAQSSAVIASIWNWLGSRDRAQPRRYKRMAWTETQCLIHHSGFLNGMDCVVFCASCERNLSPGNIEHWLVLAPTGK